MRSSTPGDTNGYGNDHVDLELPDRRSPRHRNVDDFTVEKFKRRSNKWIAAAYNVTAIVGVGVLSIPHAMVFLTWAPGLLVLLLALVMTFFTMKQLIQLHEFEFDDQNRSIRYITYHKLAQRAYRSKTDQEKDSGRKAFWIILTMQLLVEVSFDILYTVAAGEAMNRIHDSVEHCNPFHIFVWFAVFAAIQIVLSALVPTFEDIKWIVVPAAVLSVCYSTIAWVTVVYYSGPKDVSYNPPKQATLDHCADNVKLTDEDVVFRAFNAVGIIAFAYAAHNVVLEIQNGIPSTPERSSEREMMRAVWITYVMVAICYIPMSIAVYKIHGNQISQNVLSFIQYHVTEAPKGVVIAANLMLILHLIGSYQIFAVPVFTQLGIFFKIKPRSSKMKRILVRTLYIGFTTGLAMVFPYFSPLLGFFGGFVIAPTTFFLPCIIWLKINNEKRWRSKSFYLNLACIILGVFFMIIASIGGLYLIIQETLYDNFKIWTHDWKRSKLYLTKSFCTSCQSNCSCKNL